MTEGRTPTCRHACHPFSHRPTEAKGLSYTKDLVKQPESAIRGPAVAFAP